MTSDWMEIISTVERAIQSRSLHSFSLVRINIEDDLRPRTRPSRIPAVSLGVFIEAASDIWACSEREDSSKSFDFPFCSNVADVVWSSHRKKICFKSAIGVYWSMRALRDDSIQGREYLSREMSKYRFYISSFVRMKLILMLCLG
jgi:hypothetical protein